MNTPIRGIFLLRKKNIPYFIDSGSASCLCIPEAILLNLRGSDGLTKHRLVMAAPLNLICYVKPLYFS